MYSSVRDLCTSADLFWPTSSLLPSTTQRWLKPVAFTQSLLSAIGMPWEIFRQDQGTFVVDIYTKGGSIGQDQSLLVVIRQYDVVFAVLTARSESRLCQDAAETIRKHLIPALHRLSWRQAKVTMSGLYTDQNDNQSLAISRDELCCLSHYTAPCWLHARTRLSPQRKRASVMHTCHLGHPLH